MKQHGGIAIGMERLSRWGSALRRGGRVQEQQQWGRAGCEGDHLSAMGERSSGVALDAKGVASHLQNQDQMGENEKENQKDQGIYIWITL